MLYDDDGQTFDYEKGAYTQKVFKVSETAGKLVGSVKELKSGATWSYGAVNWHYMSK